MSTQALRINRNVLAQFLPDHDAIKQFERLMDQTIFDSDDITEGTVNLFYTEARFTASLATKDTDDLAEGAVNFYYTEGRFNTSFSSKSTTDLSEGTNLYYTQGRFDSAFTAKSTTDLSEGTNLYWTTGRGQAVIDADTTLLKTDGSRARVAVTETVATTSTTETIDVTTCTVLRQTANSITTSLSTMATGSRIVIKNRGGGANALNVTVDGVASPSIADGEAWDIMYNGTDWDRL